MDIFIADLLKKVDDVNKLLDQQQRLTLNLQSKVELLSVKESSQTVKTESNEDETPSENPKKSWWQRLFT